MSGADASSILRSLSVIEGGCVEQEKTWTVVLGSTPKEGQQGARDWSYPLAIGIKGATKV